MISPGSGSFGFFTNWGITSSASDPVAGAVSGASNADEDIFVIGANIRYNATSTHYDTIIDFDVSKDKIDISSTRTSEEEALASVVSVSGGHCQFTVTTRFNDTRIVVLEGVTKSEFEQYFEAVFSVGNSAAISDNAGSSSSSTINSINNTHLPIPSFNAAYSGSRNDLEWSSSSPISGIEIWRGNWIVNMGISSQRNSIGFGHDIYLDDTVPGSMTISGNDGQDIILMSDGNDGIHGDDQADLLIGGGGDDAIEGNRGNDFILGGNGDDAWLIGGWGNDLIDGGGGNDAIEGEYGDDRILGNGGADVVSGGFGNDTIFGDGQVGRDGSSALNNGIGTFESWFEADFLAWLPSSGSQFTSTSTTLKRTSVSNEVALHFDISSKSYSGAFLVGSSGGDAGDTVYGDFGNDLIFGGAGSADSIYGGSGNDTIYGHGGSVGEADGNDTIRSGSGNDSVGGGLGDDSIIGNFGDDYLSGDAGNDTIVAGKGADTLIGGDGADNMEAGAGVDKFLFDNLDGQDTISGFALVDDYLMFNSNVGIGILSHNSSATVLSYSGGSGKITILGVDIASITELNYSYTWT